MRQVSRWACAVGLWLCALAVWAGNGPREVWNLNYPWKYAPGDFSGAEQSAFDDAAWETVGVPHSFSIPYFMSKDFYVGYGWYRQELDLPKRLLKKKLFLEFDGVFREAEVFVNGKPAGQHDGGG